MFINVTRWFKWYRCASTMFTVVSCITWTLDSTFMDFLNNNLLIKKYNYLGVWFLIFTWISDLYKEIKEPVLYVDISILPSESLDRFDLDFDLETRVLSLVFRFLKRKIIYDQARLNGGINYEYPGYNTVFSIDQFYSNFDLGT